MDLDTTFYMKEVVSEQQTTSQGEEFIMYRFYKATIDASYGSTPDTIWKSIISTGSFVNVESNVRYVRLKFPPSLNKQWDGNEENSGNEQTYLIESLDVPYVLNDTLSFEKTLTVSHNRKSTLIDTNIVYEVYAENIGLIERSVKNSYILVSSYQYSQKLLNHGN